MTGRSPGITVVIPHYQNPQALTRAVASVIKQSTPLDLVVVDDASGDQGAAAASVIERLPTHVQGKLVTLKGNVGPGGARNAGLRVANTDLVAFLDADDEWVPEKLTHQIAWMAGHPEVALSCHRVSSTDDQCNAAPSWALMSNKNLIYKNRIATSSVMLRVSALRGDFAFPERRFSEDYQAWLILASRGCLLSESRAPLARHFRAAGEHSGLSAQLWPMEKGELDALGSARQEGLCSFIEYLTACAWSLIKFARRALRGGPKWS